MSREYACYLAWLAYPYIAFLKTNDTIAKLNLVETKAQNFAF